MARRDPRDRPALNVAPLIAALARHQVDWVLAGSHVLALHGAEIAANDLDVVPDLAPANLKRLAACLEELDAVAAYLDGWGGARGTLKACQDWRPAPPTAEHLDWLYVTEHGLLDIVIAKADPYEDLRSDATQHTLNGTKFWVCDPRRVLRALEGRTRRKDLDRKAVYACLRNKFGMDPEDGD